MRRADCGSAAADRRGKTRMRGAKSFERKVLRTITRNALPGRDAPALVAVSGGADSVALLRALLALGYRCEAAHCNFRLRGAESERDEKFVRTLCGRLRVRLHTASFDTKDYAASRRISVEMAARELRYGFFSRLLDSGRMQFVAVAHNRGDNAETVLLNLLRGAGLRGLCAMQYFNGRVARPLLDVSRAEITAYLDDLGQDYVTDSTNLQSDATRNRIRLEVMPLLRTLNPSVEETLHRTAARLRGAQAVYGMAVDRMLGSVEMRANGDELLAAANVPAGAPLEAVLHEWLHPRGFGEAQAACACEASRRGARARFETKEYVLFFERGVFCLARRGSFPDFEPFSMPEEGSVRLWDGSLLSAERCGGCISRQELTQPRNAFLDSARVKSPLTVRTVREGDVFVPFGMKGTKLVSDYLADRKIPVQERLRQLVVADREKIVWLVGRRVDDRVKVTPDAASVIRLTVGRLP